MVDYRRIDFALVTNSDRTKQFFFVFLGIYDEHPDYILRQFIFKQLFKKYFLEVQLKIIV